MGICLKSMKRKPCVGKVCKKLNNKGFSLIEVLVAMVILAIVTLPILSSFASAAKVNANARKQENTNAMAQKTIEQFKSLSISQLTNGINTIGPHTMNNSATGVASNRIELPSAASLVPNNQFIYKFDMASFDGNIPKTDTSGNPYCVGANGEKIFVSVTLDPSSYSDKTTVLPAGDIVSNNINTYDMPTFSDINVDSNYVIMQQIYLHDNSILQEFSSRGVTGIREVDIRREVKVTSNVVANATPNVSLATSMTGNVKNYENVSVYNQDLTVQVKYVVTKPGDHMDKEIQYEYGNSTFKNNDKAIENAAKINQLNGLVGDAAYKEFKKIYLLYNAFDKYKVAAGIAEDRINIYYTYPPLVGVSGLSKDVLKMYVVEQTVKNIKDNQIVKLNKDNVSVYVNNSIHKVDLATNGTLNLDGNANSNGAVDIFSNITDWSTLISSTTKRNNNITQNAASNDGPKYLYNIKVELWVGEKTGDPFMTMTSTKEN